MHWQKMLFGNIVRSAADNYHTSCAALSLRVLALNLVPRFQWAGLCSPVDPGEHVRYA